ncbi:MAG: hypothetical protein SGI92_22280 [Bryobacteraceae bacterium]|nr:hypothetical protein [Bryobacteraceae bacterium]
MPSDEATLAQAIRHIGASHAVLGMERYTGPLYATLPGGGVLDRFGVGHDGVGKVQASAA